MANCATKLAAAPVYRLEYTEQQLRVTLMQCCSYCFDIAPLIFTKEQAATGGESEQESAEYKKLAHL